MSLAKLKKGFYTKLPKLSTRADYPNWKFAVSAMLRAEGLWAICQNTEPETDPRKRDQLNFAARARLILCVESQNYEHIASATTAHAVWENLRLAFEDHSWVLRVMLARELAEATHRDRLAECDTIEEYVQPVMDVLYQMHAAGCGVSDEMAGAWLLAGLDARFDPMIRSMDNASGGGSGGGGGLSVAQIRQRLMRVDLATLKKAPKCWKAKE